MQIVVIRATTLLDLQTQAHVEGFFTGPADPEVSLSRLAHLDHSFFESTGPDHQLMDVDAPFGAQCFTSTNDLGNRCHKVLLPRRGYRNNFSAAVRWTVRRS
jgi:hypothetical protein